MSVALLPSSAAAFASRSTVSIVLNLKSKTESWLTQQLITTGCLNSELRTSQQHKKHLETVLSSEDAIWTLSCMMVPKAPESDLRRDPNLLVEAIFNYHLIHIKAYVTHIDFEVEREVGFKLTQETIKHLTTYHKDIHVRNESNRTCNWAEKEQQLQILHDNFFKAVNRYVFRTGVEALEGLMEGGEGELLDGRSERVKSDIASLLLPLSSPFQSNHITQSGSPLFQPHQQDQVFPTTRSWAASESKHRLASTLPLGKPYSCNYWSNSFILDTVCPYCCEKVGQGCY
jgi:hypothetical protein